MNTALVLFLRYTELSHQSFCFGIADNSVHASAAHFYDTQCGNRFQRVYTHIAEAMTLVRIG